MKALIIEDEYAAAQSLRSLIEEVARDIEVLTILQSIEDSIEWLQANPAPDVVFMDIHLADGSSFSIFEEVKVECPVIFTTAYDEYALKAFDFYSVDYLLKPISDTMLERAIGKLRTMMSVSQEQKNGLDTDMINNLLASFRQKSKAYRSSLLVHHKDKLIPLPVKDIAYIYIDAKIVRGITFAGQSYVLDQSMDGLVEVLGPQYYFRANSQYIVAHTSLKDMSVWLGYKLAKSTQLSTL